MRRRPLRRPARTKDPRRVPPALRHANELMESGYYAEAALAFEKIAQRADARRGARAPLFHLRAGRAFILSREIPKGMEHIRIGLTSIAVKKNWEPLHRFGQRTVDELNELGLHQESEEVATYLKQTLPEKPEAQRASSRPSLPTQCPGCGAPIRSDETIWIDQKTAECLYCSNPVQGENQDH